MFIGWNSKSLTRFTRQVPKLLFILIYPTWHALPITIQDSLQSVKTCTLCVPLAMFPHSPNPTHLATVFVHLGNPVQLRVSRFPSLWYVTPPGWPGFLYIPVHPVQSSVRAFFTLHCSTVLVFLHSHFSSWHLGSKETSMILARSVPRTRSKSETPRSEYLLKERRKFGAKKGFFFLI